MAESCCAWPILNSPYEYPGRHWELDAERQPTNRIIDHRRQSELIAPVPKRQRRRPLNNVLSQYGGRSILMHAPLAGSFRGETGRQAWARKSISLR
jgi:hypothetical protein